MAEADEKELFLCEVKAWEEGLCESVVLAVPGAEGLDDTRVTDVFARSTVWKLFRIALTIQKCWFEYVQIALDRLLTSSVY